MEYVKIHSLWKREGHDFDQKKEKPQASKKKHSLIVGDYARPEFANIQTWRVSEKVDGTNVRIYFCTHPDGYEVNFMGRTSEAVLQEPLLNYLKKTFTSITLREIAEDVGTSSFVLYGEGYGPKIQAVGKNYREDQGFILFDGINQYSKWLSRSTLKTIAEKLSIPLVPDLGIMDEKQIVEFVKSKPLSLCSITPQPIEGIVARAEPTVYFESGVPVIFKLKCKDFEAI